MKKIRTELPRGILTEGTSELQQNMVSLAEITDISQITNALAVGVLDRKTEDAPTLVLVDHMPPHGHGVNIAHARVSTAHVAFIYRLSMTPDLMMVTLTQKISDAKRDALREKLCELNQTNDTGTNIHVEFATPESTELHGIPLRNPIAVLEDEGIPHDAYEEGHRLLNNALARTNFTDGLNRHPVLNRGYTVGYVTRADGAIWHVDVSRPGQKMHRLATSQPYTKVVCNPSDEPMLTNWEQVKGSPILTAKRIDLRD